jgi:MOSC domain-containing protein
MAAAVAAIYRYPVKGLSAEAMDRVALTPGECLPHDRRFAIALGTTAFDPLHPAWLPKTRFVMLMRDESLARLATRFDAATGLLSIAADGRVLRAEPIGEAAGGRRIAAFLEEFLAGKVAGPLRVVAAPGHAFADARKKPNATTDKYVSLINLASIRALEAAIGAGGALPTDDSDRLAQSHRQHINPVVDPLRFRANLYFDGVPAWAELDWQGGEIKVGGARLRPVAAITRCAATAVNPRTAERDLDIVAALERHFGHNLMGVYAEVAGGGEIAIGDVLAPPG